MGKEDHVPSEQDLNSHSSILDGSKHATGRPSCTTYLDTVIQAGEANTHDPEPPLTPEDASDSDRFTPPERIDTGIALREVHDYQTGRRNSVNTSPEAILGGSSCSHGSIDDDSSPTRNSISTTTTSVEIEINSVVPTLRVRYERLLVGVVAGQVSLQVLLAHCVNGALGWSGQVAAGVILTLFIVIRLVSVVFRVYIEVKELKSGSPG